MRKASFFLYNSEEYDIFLKYILIFILIQHIYTDEK